MPNKAGDQGAVGTDANKLGFAGQPFGGGDFETVSSYLITAGGLAAGAGKLPDNPTSGFAGADLWLGGGSATGGNANGGSTYIQCGALSGSGTVGGVYVVNSTGSTVATIDNSGNFISSLNDSFNFGTSSNSVGMGSDAADNVYLGKSSSRIYFATGALQTITFPSTGYLAWSSASASSGATTFSSGMDVTLHRDAADILAQRRTTNAQTFRLYNTYMDASNYERGFVQWSSNVLYFGAEIAGTGAQRAIQYDCHTSRGRAYVKSDATGNSITLGCQTIAVLTLDGGASAGNVGLYNTYWLNGVVVPINFGSNNGGVSNRQGDSLVIRVRGGSGNATASYFGIGTAFPQASGTTAHGQEDALLVRLNATATTVLAFGASFANTVPALIRSGTTLKVRLADDSADAPITVSYIRTVPVTVATLPAAATAGNGARAFVTDANATTFASIVAAGGANNVPVYSDGTNWRIG